MRLTIAAQLWVCGAKTPGCLDAECVGQTGELAVQASAEIGQAGVGEQGAGLLDREVVRSSVSTLMSVRSGGYNPTAGIRR